MQLVSYFHKYLLENVEQAHKKQQKIYASKKGLQMFEEFEGECTKVKMCKPCKKKNPACSYEGPYIFVTYKDGKGF